MPCSESQLKAARKYRENHRSICNLRTKIWIKNNPKKYTESNKKSCMKYYLKTRSKQNQKSKQNYELNKAKIKAKQKEYQQKHRKQIKNRLYQNHLKRMADPEYRKKTFDYQLKWLAKSAKILKMDAPSYKILLQNWSKLVRQQNANKCAICGNVAREAHHIIFRRFYPKLSLNLNNGIPLCRKHHLEAHGIFS